MDDISQAIWNTSVILGSIAIGAVAIWFILTFVKLFYAFYVVWKYGPSQIIAWYEQDEAEARADEAKVGWVGRDGEVHHPDGWEPDLDAEAKALEDVDRIERGEDDTQP